MTFPASHGDKLRALLNNEKLPSEEKLRINAAVENYAIWLDQLLKAQGATTEELVGNLVSILNQYRLYVDINLIFDSPTDFLYRQKGQLKLT